MAGRVVDDADGLPLKTEQWWRYSMYLPPAGEIYHAQLRTLCSSLGSYSAGSGGGGKPCDDNDQQQRRQWRSLTAGVTPTYMTSDVQAAM